MAHPDPPRHCKRAGYPAVAPPKQSRNVTEERGCPLAAHPNPRQCKRAGHPVAVPPKHSRNMPEEARQAMPPQRTPSQA